MEALKALARHRGLKYEYGKLPLWNVQDPARTGLQFLLRTARRDLVAEGARVHGRRVEEEVGVRGGEEADEVEEVGEEEDQRLLVHRGDGRRFVTVARRRVAAQQVIYNRGGCLEDEDNPIDLVGGNYEE